MNVDALSKSQILDLLGAARAYRESHWLALLVAYLHGLRASEVIAIRRVDIHQGFLTVERGKRSERTTQPLMTSEIALLSERAPLIEYASKMGLIHPLFNYSRQTFWNIIRRHGATAGIPEHQRHPHILKHSCGTHMYEKTRSLPAVQKWLGHKTGNSTLVYLRMSQGDAARCAQDSLCV